MGAGRTAVGRDRGRSARDLRVSPDIGRILLTWATFAIGGALATLYQWDAGFAAFGWGCMAGAVVGASVGIALVTEASVNLTYLLFVGNNPAVVGHGGRWL